MAAATDIHEPLPTFSELGLKSEILRALDESGYETPTPIQAQAIPLALDGRNIVGLAQTGTGKTASFTLPMLHVLSSGRAKARMPRSLILSPTRELATQTAENFERYGKYLKLSMALLIGGVAMGDQEKALEKGVDVLIATPGRLLDWFERGKILFGGLDVLVIDEADRMLDMGFMPDVERIMALIVNRRQTMLFSATMPKEVRRLADRFLTDPVEIKVQAPALDKRLVVERLVETSPVAKSKKLRELIEQEDVQKAIVFCNRKKDISGLMRELQRSGLNARDLHGDLEQAQRLATLEAFKNDEVDYLVATDVAARGLDISDMPVVVNFDVPMNAEDYIHRIGRTGRAGKEGRAFTFACRNDAKYLANIERMRGGAIEKLVIGKVSKESVDAAGGEQMDAESAPVEKAAPVRKRRTRAATADAGVETPDATPQNDERPNRRHRAPRQADAERGEKRPSRSRSRDKPEEEAPIVGLGPHTPAFLLRPTVFAEERKAS